LLAPVLGAVLQVNYGWRANFAVTSIVSALLLINCLFFLPETLPEGNRRHWSLPGMFVDFARLLRHGVYLRYLISVCLAFGGLFVLISTSSFVFQNHFGLSPLQFSLSFSVCVAGYIVGTLVGARLSQHHDVETLTLVGSVLLGAAGLAMILLSFIDKQQVWHLLAPLFVLMIGIGFVLPQGMAGALTPFPEMAGTASSLLGFMQNSVAALFGMAAAWAIGFDANAMAWIIGGSGLANLVLNLYASKSRQENRT